MSYGVEKLEAQRKSAFEGRNAIKYFALCNDLGIGEHAVEDFDLYERGQLEDSNFRFWQDTPMREVSYDVAKVARIALRRFPELERGEKISVKEIKKRLGEIRSVGYDVKPYSKMSAREAWTYLQEIRREVASDAKEYCPSVLELIDFENERRKREVYDSR